ncbi:MAG: ABC transporter ATP-binding protein [Planctomycetes bacterium]|nr:ABC transporter ATP-binding protein [Planctomycetota bacterium]
MTVACELVGAGVDLGGRAVLRGLDLSIACGEYHVLLGPSGSGKTTLLRAIAGLVPLAAGEIRLDGVVVSSTATHISPERRGVGFVFQSLALWPHMSVEQHLGFVLRQSGMGAADRSRRAAAAIDRFRLGGKERRRPSELSGGEQQRLALARALVLEPRCLLLDEPLGAVDEALRAELAAELAALPRERSICVLHVTHDQREGLSLADRVCVLREGRIEQTATPEQLVNYPATEFVASFVGKHSVLDGEIACGKLVTPIGQVDAAGRPDGKVKYAVSAEHVALDADGATARITARHWDGTRWMLTVTGAGFELRIAAPQGAAVGSSVRVRLVALPWILG